MRKPLRLRFQLLAFSATRTILNSGFRMVYPFLPALARGLGVDLQTMALAVTARSALGALSPLLGSLADVRGRRWAMLVGLILTAGGYALVVARPAYLAVFLALMLAMAGKLIFDPAMQAYLGDRVAYARRGLAIAITELGWSTSSLIGIPIIGWIMDRRGWSAPFPWLVALTLGAALLLWRSIPADPPSGQVAQGLRANFRTILTHPATLAGLSIGLLTSTGNETVNIVYGAWMETSFGLKIAALGAATAIIGIAELTGEGAVAAISDRVGKRRLIALAIALNGAAALALPPLSGSLAGALTGLFFFYFTFEIVVVASIPLMTQILPGARATVMATNVAGLSLGRALGAAAGPALFRAGLWLNAAVATTLDVLAFASLLFFVRLPEED
jgi:predicted MFS family arabinose efflux permease